MTDQIRFDDGAAYERYMGQWSHLVGDAFLEWLGAESGLRWLDVGCGNGAFTELVAERRAPTALYGIDPSEAQLAFARGRPALRLAQFQLGDAMALPFDDDVCDVAVMPLVIFFVPDPLRGVQEMARVVRRGGIVSAYAWDMAGGGFPYAVLRAEIGALGYPVPVPPSEDASRMNVLRSLWASAGLERIATREIAVHRTFASFDDYWTTILGSASMGRVMAAMSASESTQLQAQVRVRLPADADGRITYEARANAIAGRVP